MPKIKSFDILWHNTYTKYPFPSIFSFSRAYTHTYIRIKTQTKHTMVITTHLQKRFFQNFFFRKIWIFAPNTLRSNIPPLPSIYFWRFAYLCTPFFTFPVFTTFARWKIYLSNVHLLKISYFGLIRFSFGLYPGD